ncbi:MAG: globin [Rhodothermales bacterium]
MQAKFRSSLLRCLSNIHFLERFYDTFMASSPEVRNAFAHSDMERQMAMLNASLYQLMNLYEKRDDKARAFIQELGASHGKHGHQIPPALYDLWLDSLLKTVEECDAQYDASIGQAWREVMSYGIGLMKSNWDAQPKTPRGAEPAIAPEEIQHLADRLKELSQEASHRSDLERDSEASAFQFGQYRAYLHASQVVHELLNKK